MDKLAADIDNVRRSIELEKERARLSRSLGETTDDAEDDRIQERIDEIQEQVWSLEEASPKSWQELYDMDHPTAPRVSLVHYDGSELGGLKIFPDGRAVFKDEKDEWGLITSEYILIGREKALELLAITREYVQKRSLELAKMKAALEKAEKTLKG